MKCENSSSIHDWPCPEKFEIELILVLAASFEDEVTEESDGRFVSRRDEGEDRLEHAGFLQSLAVLCSERLEEREVSSNRSHIEEDERVFCTVKFGLGQPYPKIVQPVRKRLPPAQIARHVVASTQRIAAGRKCLLHERCHTREVIVRGV